LDVSPTDPPAAADVPGIVLPREQVVQPAPQGALEPFDLGRSARDHLARFGMALDFRVEIIDQFDEVGGQQRPQAGDPGATLLRPASVGTSLQEWFVICGQVHRSLLGACSISGTHPALEATTWSKNGARSPPRPRAPALRCRHSS